MRMGWYSSAEVGGRTPHHILFSPAIALVRLQRTYEAVNQSQVAKVDDSETGGSNIASADFEIRYAVGTPRGGRHRE